MQMWQLYDGMLVLTLSQMETIIFIEASSQEDYWLKQLTCSWDEDHN